jgi:Protein of unknown function (DUF2817)
VTRGRKRQGRIRIAPAGRARHPAATVAIGGTAEPDRRNGMDVANYFSSDRKAARGHFLSACRAFNLDVVPFYAPREVVASGEPIVEVARVGRPYAPTVIALTCGAWEDEGLCASGIFTTLLRHDFTRHLSRDMALVLIHAIAPAGLSGLGRGTPTVSEPEQQWSHKALAAAESRFVDYVQQSALPAASGSGPVIPWQARVLCEIADQFFHQSKRTVVIDLRTGPGPYGEADLLPCQIVHGDPLVDIDPLFGIKDNPDETPAWGTPGNLAHGLIAALGRSQISGAVLEFGTYSMRSILSAGTGTTFYPRDEQWREKVWELTTTTFHQLLAALRQNRPTASADQPATW